MANGSTPTENDGTSSGAGSMTWSRWFTESPCAWLLARLFWSGRAPKPQDAGDPEWVATVLSTILQEATARDWRTIRWDAVWPIWDQVTLDPRIRRFWDAHRVEENAMDHRDQVLDGEQHGILRVAAQVLPGYGFELAGGTALAAGYLGHRRSDDFVDAYALLQRYELSQLMAWAPEKDPGFDRDWFIRALVQAEKTQPHQVALLVPIDWEHLRLTFRQAALRLDREARASNEGGVP